jgi:hypothetical protein
MIYFEELKQEVEEMLDDVSVTDGDYKTGYIQAVLNVLSILNFYNNKIKENE